jgi:hypothetical protein
MIVRYYDERWATVRFDDSVQAVWVEWKAYAEAEQYRSVLDCQIEIFRQKKSSRLLGDCRHFGPVTQLDQQWTHQDWHPRAVVAGLRWIAIVSPRAAVSRLSIKQMVTKINNTELVTGNFDDMELARAWLRSPTRPG